MYFTMGTRMGPNVFMMGLPMYLLACVLPFRPQSWRHCSCIGLFLQVLLPFAVSALRYCPLQTFVLFRVPALVCARCRLSACILAFSSVALQSLVLRCRFSACRIEDHLFSAMHDPKRRAVAYKGKGKGKGDGRDTMTGNGSGKCAGKGAAKGDGKGVGEVVGKGACTQLHSLLFFIVGAQLS